MADRAAAAASLPRFKDQVHDLSSPISPAAAGVRRVVGGSDERTKHSKTSNSGSPSNGSLPAFKDQVRDVEVPRPTSAENTRIAFATAVPIDDSVVNSNGNHQVITATATDNNNNNHGDDDEEEQMQSLPPQSSSPDDVFAFQFKKKYVYIAVGIMIVIVAFVAGICANGTCTRSDPEPTQPLSEEQEGTSPEASPNNSTPTDEGNNGVGTPTTSPASKTNNYLPTLSPVRATAPSVATQTKAPTDFPASPPTTEAPVRNLTQEPTRQQGEEPENGEPEPEPPTRAPIQDRGAAMTSFINSIKLSSGSIEPGTGNSEERALSWLIEADPFQLSPESASDRLRLQQRYALATLFQSSTGRWSTSTNWLETDECDWFGISCNAASVVEAVELDAPEPDQCCVGNSLDGTLPQDLFLLTALTLLDIGANDAMTGTIPTQIGLLTRLTELSLAGTSLQGTIPEEISNLTEIDNAYFGHMSRLVGSVPAGICPFIEEGDNLWADCRFECECCNYCCNSDGDCFPVE